jgi:O-acetyl-ADP-ribose deacetylase (regulator of RNase III)
MIELHTGDILEADAQALVNTVNCVGVMGRGIALQFKKAFPGYFRAYARACQEAAIELGTVHVHDRESLANPRYLISFPTKNHWRGRSRLADIEAGLRSLVAEVTARNIRSIAIPPLGCGLGGLSWTDVLPRIERAAAALPDVRVLVFAPTSAPRRTPAPADTPTPKMTPGRAALLGLMHRYLAGLMDPDVSLLEVHKAMYFMQEAGERLNLQYTKGHYGPYSKNLRHVLTAIDGHWISGFDDAEDVPDKPLALQDGAAERALAFLRDHPATLSRFERVLDLIDGFESPSGMELLATVHWVARTEGAGSATDAIRKVHEWNPRKQRIDPRQIELAWNTLAAKGWLETASPG